MAGGLVPYRCRPQARYSSKSSKLSLVTSRPVCRASLVITVSPACARWRGMPAAAASLVILAKTSGWMTRRASANRVCAW